MKSLSACWLRRSGSLLVSLALILGVLFPLSPPAEAGPRSARARHAKVAQQRSGRRWIEVDLSSQRLIAWEGKRRVYSMRISSGKRSTPTPTGTYRVRSKHRSTRMRGRGYNIPNVPYTMYYSGGYAIHGAFWHNRFGTRVSHGCINLPVAQARRLFNWAPHGTRIVVHH